MRQSIFLTGVLLATTVMTPALAQTDAAADAVTIVLGEEPDLMEPCMATRSNIGRIVMQNVSETLTELDTEAAEGVSGRLATGWEMVDDTTWRFACAKA